MRNRIEIMVILTIVAAVMVGTFGCDKPSPVSTTTFNLTQVQSHCNDPVDPGDPAGPSNPSNLIRLEPSSVAMNVGQSVNVRVVISTPAGNEVPTESLQVSIADSSVAALTQIDGRTMQLRGVSAGVTSALVMANGLSVSLIITVN